MDVSSFDNLKMSYDGVERTSLTNAGVFTPNSYGKIVQNQRDLEISAGEITVGFASFYVVDTELLSAADDLETINGGQEGMRIILRALDSSRVITLKRTGGNIRLDNGTDKVLSGSLDNIELIYSDAFWRQISYSNNL